MGALGVERYGRPGNGYAVGAAYSDGGFEVGADVAFDARLAEVMLLAGEIVAVRCAGFLATGGGDLCFAAVGC